MKMGMVPFATLLLSMAGHAEDDGVKFDCGDLYDDVWVKHERVATDTVKTTITIESVTPHNRSKGELHPILQYDIIDDVLTLNGKACQKAD